MALNAHDCLVHDLHSDMFRLQEKRCMSKGDLSNVYPLYLRSTLTSGGAAIVLGIALHLECLTSRNDGVVLSPCHSLRLVNGRHVTATIGEDSLRPMPAIHLCLMPTDWDISITQWLTPVVND